MNEFDRRLILWIIYDLIRSQTTETPKLDAPAMAMRKPPQTAQQQSGVVFIRQLRDMRRSA